MVVLLLFMQGTITLDGMAPNQVNILDCPVHSDYIVFLILFHLFFTPCRQLSLMQSAYICRFWHYSVYRLIVYLIICFFFLAACCLFVLLIFLSYLSFFENRPAPFPGGMS